MGQCIEEAAFVICSLDNPLAIADCRKGPLLLLLTEHVKCNLEF